VKKYLILGFALLLVSNAAIGWFATRQMKRADEAEIGRDAAVTLSAGWEHRTTEYVNKYGDAVKSIKALEVDKKNIIALHNHRELQWLNKFDGLKKDKSNLKSAMTFTSTFDTSSVKETIKYLPCQDSIKTFVYDYQDEWNNIHAIVIDTPTLDIRDRYYAVIESRRPKNWFIKFQWRKRETYAEITNSNKRIPLDSLSVIVVK
jgi:hypothetical protein